MKKLVAALIFSIFFCQASWAITEETINHKIFGKITIYHPDGKPVSLALFVSGDGGWQHGVLNMARNIARQGAMVAGIDAKDYLTYLGRVSSACYYPAADFERLSMQLQKKYNFPGYIKPVLIGYSFGATLVYGLLAQAPANTFKGAIGIGFCPDIELKKPLCDGNGLHSHAIKAGKLYYLDKTQKLTAPFIVLNGVRDLTCSYPATVEFLKDIPFAEMVTLPKVGHGFSIDANWLPQFNQAFKRIVERPSFTGLHSTGNTAYFAKEVKELLQELPLTVVPAKGPHAGPLLFMISGDGGWTSFDQSLAEHFAEKGTPVIGLDAQKYFWNAKTPQKTTADISKAIRTFMQEWNKKSLMLGGYSFGACIMPFVANRLPEDLARNLTGICLLSPAERIDFEIHVSDMLHLDIRNEQFDVLQEVKNSVLKPVCLFGSEEDRSRTERFKNAGAKIFILPGTHHFDNNFDLIVERILKSGE